jgi:hypothetical protein
MGLISSQWILGHFMSISSRKIRSRLLKLWPELVYVWLTDPIYLPAPKEMKDVLELWEGELTKYAFKKNILECEEFALFCHAFVRQRQLYCYNDKYNWAFGECMTKRDRVHSCNFYLTSSKIYMVEPQTGAYWEATPEDKIFFVKM